MQASGVTVLQIDKILRDMMSVIFIQESFPSFVGGPLQLVLKHIGESKSKCVVYYWEVKQLGFLKSYRVTKIQI